MVRRYRRRQRPPEQPRYCKYCGGQTVRKRQYCDGICHNAATQEAADAAAPTPAEIREACLAIQAKWTPSEEQQRIVCSGWQPVDLQPIPVMR